MKKFNFTLQSLKKYNDQVLDSEKSILGRLRAELAEMQSELDAKVAEYEQSICLLYTSPSPRDTR